MYAKPGTCVGCNFPLPHRAPQYKCMFASTGFQMNDQTFGPCQVSYHHQCIKVGPPFTTRHRHLLNLQFPSLPRLSGFICEACTVRAILLQELRPGGHDVVLLMLERMRLIDMANGWAVGTHGTYQSLLRRVKEFEDVFSLTVLPPTQLASPPWVTVIPLMWSQQ